MKSKSRFLWLYTVILFSVALILIMFAGMTQQNYEKELESHQTAAVGMKKSVAELSQTNTLLTEENTELKSKVAKLTEENAELSKSSRVSTTLLNAICEYEEGDKKSAKELIAKVDASLLTPEQLRIYNKIMK